MNAQEALPTPGTGDELSDEELERGGLVLCEALTFAQSSTHDRSAVHS